LQRLFAPRAPFSVNAATIVYAKKPYVLIHDESTWGWFAYPEKECKAFLKRYEDRPWSHEHYNDFCREVDFAKSAGLMKAVAKEFRFHLHGDSTEPPIRRKTYPVP
jgi:hypothetical protein